MDTVDYTEDPLVDYDDVDNTADELKGADDDSSENENDGEMGQDDDDEEQEAEEVLEFSLKQCIFSVSLLAALGLGKRN